MAEWVLATWMNQLDPNILGVRRVDDEKNGSVVPVVHIAIPLAYQRKQLARTLAIEQIEDAQSTVRVNLIASSGSVEAHSYIRVAAEVILAEFIASMQTHLLVSKEINDQTIGVPEHAIEDFLRETQRKQREEDARLRSAIQQSLAMRNAAIGPHQIQLLVNKKTQEKWVKIKDVDRSLRTPVKRAIRQAGIEASSPPADDSDGADWAILFAASEARKLLAE